MGESQNVTFREKPNWRQRFMSWRLEASKRLVIIEHPGVSGLSVLSEGSSRGGTSLMAIVQALIWLFGLMPRLPSIAI